MPEFWFESGFPLAGRSPDGKLVASDDLLRAWWQRPEVAPVPESCHSERALHAALLAEPRRHVSSAEIAAIEDADTRENYQAVLDWRARLLAAPTLETAYLDLFRNGRITVPPLFIDQLAQIIVHGILENSEDALEVRAAELFFRRQKVSLQNGAVLLADAETVSLHEAGGNYGDLGRLLVEARINPRKADLDVLDRGNADKYWNRSDKRDMVIGFNPGSPALAAFCYVIEKWIRHFYGVDVTVSTLTRIEDQQWSWHIGLDAEASSILNDLYEGREVDAYRRQRILSLFRLDFADPAAMRPDIAGRPVYLACASDKSGTLRIKPQNLLLNLPLSSIS